MAGLASLAVGTTCDDEGEPEDEPDARDKLARRGEVGEEGTTDGGMVCDGEEGDWEEGRPGGRCCDIEGTRDVEGRGDVERVERGLAVAVMILSEPRRR